VDGVKGTGVVVQIVAGISVVVAVCAEIRILITNAIGIGLVMVDVARFFTV
jgi:hypothetical protein